MPKSKATDDLVGLHKWLIEALKKEMELEFERIKKEFVDQLDKKKDIIVSGLVLNVSKHMQVQDFGSTLRIEIKKIEND